MDASQLLEIKGAIEKRLIFEIVEQGARIDVAKYPKVRFTLEFSFDSHGLLGDSGIEIRYRRAPR